MRFVWMAGLAAIAAAQDFSTIATTMAGEMAERKVTGAALAVVRGDKVVYSIGQGVANASTGEPVRAEMLFRAGSTTKMMTAAALVKLSLDGKIGMKTPIGEKFPDLPAALRPLTPHQLLSHTSGLIPDTAMSGSHDDEALDRNVRSWGPERFLAKPGEEYSYSNHGYALAGWLVEKLSGRSYADAIDELVFAPVGMTRTTFRPLIAMTWPLAQGHNKQSQVIRPAADAAGFWPAGSMFVNVADFARFVVAFMNGGKLEGKQVIDPRVIAELTSPQVAIPASKTTPAGSSYGYGLIVKDVNGLRIWEHTGSRSGYASRVVMAPDHKVAAIVLMNSDGAALDRTVNEVRRILIP